MKTIKNKILACVAVILMIAPLTTINIASQESDLNNEEIFELLVRESLFLDDDEVLTESHFEEVTYLSTSFHEEPHNWEEGNPTESHQLTDLSLLAKLPNLSYMSFNPLKDKPILPSNVSVLDTLGIEFLVLGDKEGYGSQVDVTDEQRLALTKVYRQFLDCLNGERLDSIIIEDDQISDYQWLLGLDMGAKVEYIYNAYTELSNNPKIKLNYEFSHLDDEGNKIYKMHFVSPLPTVLNLSNEGVIEEDSSYKNVIIDPRSYLNIIENSEDPIFYDVNGNVLEKDSSGHHSIDLFFSETLFQEIEENMNEQIEGIKQDIEYYQQIIEELKEELLTESDPAIIEQKESDLEYYYEIIRQLEDFVEENEAEGISNVVLYYLSINQEISDEDSNSYISLHNDYEIVLGREVPEFYTVNFESNGGTPVDSINNVEENTKILEPTAPTKAGYTFVGWYKESTLETEWNFDDDLVVEDITLYAKWEQNTHTVNFESNGGTPVDSINNVEENTKILEPTAPTKAGYTFVGWYKESALENEWDFNIDVVLEDTTLYAKWEEKLEIVPEPDEETKHPEKEPQNPEESSPEESVDTPNIETGITNNVSAYLLLLAISSSLIIILLKSKKKN